LVHPGVERLTVIAFAVFQLVFLIAALNVCVVPAPTLWVAAAGVTATEYEGVALSVVVPLSENALGDDAEALSVAAPVVPTESTR
jgi:hypothetical protein